MHPREKRALQVQVEGFDKELEARDSEHDKELRQLQAQHEAAMAQATQQLQREQQGRVSGWSDAGGTRSCDGGESFSGPGTEQQLQQEWQMRVSSVGRRVDARLAYWWLEEGQRIQGQRCPNAAQQASHGVGLSRNASRLTAGQCCWRLLSFLHHLKSPCSCTFRQEEDRRAFERARDAAVTEAGEWCEGEIEAVRHVLGEKLEASQQESQQW